MATGIYKHKSLSEEAKKKLSVFWTGKKKQPFTDEHKRKISEALMGRKSWNKGKKMPKDWIHPLLGKHHTEETKNKTRGANHWNWKNGITPENHKIRHSIEFRLWREAIFARDNWTCQKTGIKGGKLHPHHIQNFAQYPELRFAIDNGITLSDEAHREFHKLYGRKNNTMEQLNEFLMNYGK